MANKAHHRRPRAWCLWCGADLPLPPIRSRQPAPRWWRCRVRAGAFVLSANVLRRHMTKGQRAMAVAMIYPNPEKGGRGKNALAIKAFLRLG